MRNCKIYYFTLTDEMRRDDKLDWLHTHPFENIEFEKITPDDKNNWINLVENDWDEMVAVASMEESDTIFKFTSLGVSTNRDEWVYDFDKQNLKDKMNYFISKYNEFIDKNDESWSEEIKWSSTLKSHFGKKTQISFDDFLILNANYRPFIQLYYYSEKILSDRLTQNHYDLFGKDLNKENKVINNNSNGKDIRFFVTNRLSDLHFLGDNLCLPLYRYDSEGNRQENITDWGLEKFRERYGELTKEDIFHYVYAVLHNPEYRKKYELNLKRDFPRIPFYDDFWKWADWGKQLMDLHINFEDVEPFVLERIDFPVEHDRKLKVKLKANKETGIIELDEKTSLSGIPKTAWEYKLGNRSALEWILDQYKEKKPSDPTIAEKFNTYQFADYKEKVIDLLQRVCNVSVQTMEIIKEMGNGLVKFN